MVSEYSCETPWGRLKYNGREVLQSGLGRRALVVNDQRGIAMLRKLSAENPGLPERLVIRTCSKILDAAGMYSLFRPVSAVEEEVPFGRGDGASIVGVHIRRTDNRRAAEVSTLGRFFGAMDAECNRDENTRIFLASDDPLVHRKVEER